MYSIGQVEKITGIKAHILRYWEEQIPSFKPKKDLSGRREYSQRDVEIVMRLKYLIYEKKFTLDGARKQIVQDACSEKMTSDTVMAIREAKAQLTDLFFALSERKNDSAEKK